MDLDTLKSGQHYKDLNDSHVIFICMENVLDNDLPVCTFENICIEDGETKLNDRAYKHFFIATTCAKMIEDEETRDFFEFLISNTAKSDFTSELKGYVADAKHNMQWRAQYMTWEMESIRLKREGIHEAQVEAAVNLYANGVPVETIAKSLHMSEEQVKEIIKGNTAEA